MSLFTKVLPGEIAYSGHELSPHWIAKQTGVFASSIVAFRGPCDVATGEMVDMEDRLQELRIEAKEMVHFLGEWFEGDLNLAIARQLLFIAGFGEILGTLLPSGLRLHRKGNDLYVLGEGEPRKLSVSIVTTTPVSSLFHFGVNVDASGAPVRAVGLNELGIDVDALVKQTLELWAREWASMAKARCKVAAR
ncbi:MAG: DUF366 family protein [Proteobacteria bacterium]|nr:MAG: DUF366 family protein [Pseudomonadota bacterium]